MTQGHRERYIASAGAHDDCGIYKGRSIRGMNRLVFRLKPRGFVIAL
jgi:hypothetical protein